MDTDPVAIVVARADVERCNIAATLEALRQLTRSPETIRSRRGRVDIAFHGYDSDRRELFEIPEVRSFVAALDAAFPYWLFFLTKQGTGLHAIAFRFLPPFLADEGQREIWPQRLRELLEGRWMPALAHIASTTGYSDAEIDSMLGEAAHYFVEGPRLPFDVDAV
jgi:hypothetical protein